MRLSIPIWQLGRKSKSERSKDLPQVRDQSSRAGGPLWQAKPWASPTAKRMPGSCPGRNSLESWVDNTLSCFKSLNTPEKKSNNKTYPPT